MKCVLFGSSAIAVKFADEGLRTLVISTDPAHSLGDALMTDLSGGKVGRILVGWWDAVACC